MKIVYLLKHAVESEAYLDTIAFVVRFTFGDIDVPVILLFDDLPKWAKIILDSRHGKDRREILLN